MKIVVNFKILTICLLIFGISIYFLIEKKINKKNEIIKKDEIEDFYNSNIIKNVKYSSKDENGNIYTIISEIGEIDLKDTSTIFLTNVQSTIELKNSEKIIITSKYGKYNINNNNTIFSKDVEVNYVENNIKGDYLDFSIERNSMIISKNVIYSNNKTKLSSDVVEINLKTKDTKIFMFDKNKKINIKSVD